MEKLYDAQQAEQDMAFVGGAPNRKVLYDIMAKSCSGPEDCGTYGACETFCIAALKAVLRNNQTDYAAWRATLEPTDSRLTDESAPLLQA